MPGVNPTKKEWGQYLQSRQKSANLQNCVGCGHFDGGCGLGNDPPVEKSACGPRTELADFQRQVAKQMYQEPKTPRKQHERHKKRVQLYVSGQLKREIK